MKQLVSLAAAVSLAASGMLISLPTAQAEVVEDIEAVVYTDRDAEREFYMCITDNHLNDRIVNNVLDARFCVDELEGRVELLEGEDVGRNIARSQIKCYQRNVLCKAPGT